MELTLGPYSINLVTKIGQGKFGVVYKGKHKENKSIVAAKQIDIKDDKAGSDALQEIKNFQNLKEHPHILKLLDYFYKHGAFWMMTEYCNAGDLEHYFMDSKPLKPLLNEQLNIMYQSASAIAFMHNQKNIVVHRDVKPGNLLMMKHGQHAIVKVTDFGLTKIAEAPDPAKTLLFTTQAGTPGFMAPEFFLQSSYDESVDVFALGMVFLAMIWFKPGDHCLAPMPDGLLLPIAALMIQFAKMDKPFPEFVKHRTGESMEMKGIKDLINRMIEYSSEQRYSMQEVVEVLAALGGTVTEDGAEIKESRHEPTDTQNKDDDVNSVVTKTYAVHTGEGTLDQSSVQRNNFAATEAPGDSNEHIDEGNIKTVEKRQTKRGVTDKSSEQDSINASIDALVNVDDDALDVVSGDGAEERTARYAATGRQQNDGADSTGSNNKVANSNNRKDDGPMEEIRHETPDVPKDRSDDNTDVKMKVCKRSSHLHDVGEGSDEQIAEHAATGTSNGDNDNSNGSRIKAEKDYDYGVTGNSTNNAMKDDVTKKDDDDVIPKIGHYKKGAWLRSSITENKHTKASDAPISDSEAESSDSDDEHSSLRKALRTTIIEHLGISEKVKVKVGMGTRSSRRREPDKVMDEFEVGDQVIILDDKEKVSELQDGYGGFSASMTKYLGKLGIVREKTRHTIIVHHDDGRVLNYNPKVLTKTGEKPFNPSQLESLTEEYSHVSAIQSKFKRGDVVTIPKDKELVKCLQAEHGGWNSRMKRILGMRGLVAGVDSDGDVKVCFVNNDAWMMNPEILVPVDTSNETIEVGDVVLIKEDISLVRKLQEGLGIWDDDMKYKLGRAAQVRSVSMNTFKVYTGKKSFRWHPDALKLVAKYDDVVEAL